jgi:hypothetical protein
MTTLELWLLRLTVFLIPTNLAYHFTIPAAFVEGRLIDYRLPRFYLSDLPVLLLLLIWVSKPNFIAGFRRLNSLHRFVLILFLFLGFTSVYQAGSLSASLPSLWFLLKLVQWYFFSLYLCSICSGKQLLNHLVQPLFLSSLFQLIVGIYQYINQSSVFGYIFFGEPLLVQSSAIATGFIGHSLKILSYGTTSHPNVLAGFLLTSLALIITTSKHNPKNRAYKYLSKISILITIIGILLTQSWVALCGFALLLSRQAKNRNHLSNQLLILLFSTFTLSIPLINLITALSPYHSLPMVESPSITRRYKLFSYSLQLIWENPSFGVGLNNFIPSLLRAKLTNTLPFLQPVHNVLLLWLSETGVIANLFYVWLLYRRFHTLKIGLSRPLTLPLLVLIPALALDHYLLTLQTGQLLVVVSLALALKHRLK